MVAAAVVVAVAAGEDGAGCGGQGVQVAPQQVAVVQGWPPVTASHLLIPTTTTTPLLNRTLHLTQLYYIFILLVTVKFVIFV